MGKALHAELQKARRRHDLLICLAVPVVVYLWAGAQAPTGADELANAYSALLYVLPALNAILMPIVMALIASRLWDMEVKGAPQNCCTRCKAAAVCLRARRCWARARSC